MFVYPKKYDVIVVGAGHAGVEAALAASRIGCQVLLLTSNVDTVGQMSCNPAIGGSAKGHIVREIDALGGEMGKTADMAGIQFRMLNTKKGPAVWSPRAQCDKKAYQLRLKWTCEKEQNLVVKQGQCERILHCDGIVLGVETSFGVQFHGLSVVITTGTFLRGLLHFGRNSGPGGRAGESNSIGLSESLKSLGLELGRLKTGTPPRLLKRSIDFSKTQVQHGDNPVPYFTFWKDDLFHVEHNPEILHHKDANGIYPYGSVLHQNAGQLPCYITYTTGRTAELVRRNLHLSPLYSGLIEGIGPRYCPSIEDKILRFYQKDSHQVFLEPEGIATDEIYVNGLSTSLPYSIQVELVRTIIGCESAEIIRPAYAVEYDFAFPHQLLPTLETKSIKNLFLAGQINGTSGYEEASAQGLISGINAAMSVLGKPQLVLGRDQAYIGVLIDDLITKGTAEPYRMFTSRAEHRLLLRQDNADQRLSEVGYKIGLLPRRNYLEFKRKRDAIQAELARLRETRYGESTLAQILRRPEVHYNQLPMRDQALPEEIAKQVEIQLKYEGYVDRQEAEVGKLKSLENKPIPVAFDYETIPSLRSEARQKLSELRPSTVGQASRISGVSPADISLLMVWLKRQSVPKASANRASTPVEPHAADYDRGSC